MHKSHKLDYIYPFHDSISNNFVGRKNVLISLCKKKTRCLALTSRAHRSHMGNNYKDLFHFI